MATLSYWFGCTLVHYPAIHTCTSLACTCTDTCSAHPTPYSTTLSTVLCAATTCACTFPPSRCAYEPDIAELQHMLDHTQHRLSSVLITHPSDRHTAGGCGNANMALCTSSMLLCTPTVASPRPCNPVNAWLGGQQHLDFAVIAM
jgi:hypothetical protein